MEGIYSREIGSKRYIHEKCGVKDTNVHNANETVTSLDTNYCNIRGECKIPWRKHITPLQRNTLRCSFTHNQGSIVILLRLRT